MEKRAARVSEAQWGILLDFLERNPNLARARGYNNSARGRAESARLWQEVAAVLNAEGSGTYKTPKEWSVYVSNYKSKMKIVVAGINSDVSGTGGGPPQRSSLSEIETRFLAIMGPGFGQTAPSVRVDPFPNLEQQQPPDQLNVPIEQAQISEDNTNYTEEVVVLNIGRGPFVEQSVAELGSAQGQEVVEVVQQSEPLVETRPPDASAPPLPRRARQPRYRTRPLAPLDEARRILSQVELQRAAADAASARALELIGQNLGRLADAVERLVEKYN